jgi:hypothetical protein
MSGRAEVVQSGRVKRLRREKSERGDDNDIHDSLYIPRIYGLDFRRDRSHNLQYRCNDLTSLPMTTPSSTATT